MRKSISAIIGNRYWCEEFDRVCNPPVEILASICDFMVDDRSLSASTMNPTDRECVL